MTGRNVLIIMADEHAREGLGCYGHPAIQTPNLDKLAAQGTRFTQAYTPSPVCVPARAAFATGRHVSQTRCWTNAQPFHGQIPGWGQRLIDAGHEVVSVGKLHYRSTADDNGFSREIIPLHCHNGVGWVQGLLRREHHIFETAHFAEEIGPGDDPYSDYDREVCAKAIEWLQHEGAVRRDKPWVLFVSFLRPHYPLTCPRDYYDLYPLDRIELPRFAGREIEYGNPVMAAFRAYYNYDDYFDERSRIVARASYYGLCSFVDALVGRLLTALEDSGRTGDTTILYTSDHGELIGEHGLWTKMSMHEQSAGIPLIMAGAGASPGICETPASLIDVYPTVLETAGLSLAAEDEALPGRSLFDLAQTSDPERAVFSEFHDGGAITGFFMLRLGRWKYIHYPGFAPQLYDLESDPREEHDLGLSDRHAEVRRKCLEVMHAQLGDPEAINTQAFTDQARRIEELGGAEAILTMDRFDFTPVDSQVEAGR